MYNPLAKKDQFHFTAVWPNVEKIMNLILGCLMMMPGDPMVLADGPTQCLIKPTVVP